MKPELTQTTQRPRKPFHPLALSAGSFAVFLAAVIIIHLITYRTFIDSNLLKYYLVFGAIGALPLIVRWYGFGLIFLAGSVAGFVVDCISSQMSGPKPTMAGGIYNILIVLASAIVGTVVQLTLHRVKKQKK